MRILISLNGETAVLPVRTLVLPKVGPAARSLKVIHLAQPVPLLWLRHWPYLVDVASKTSLAFQRCSYLAPSTEVVSMYHKELRFAADHGLETYHIARPGDPRTYHALCRHLDCSDGLMTKYVRGNCIERELASIVGNFWPTAWCRELASVVSFWNCDILQNAS